MAGSETVPSGVADQIVVVPRIEVEAEAVPMAEVVGVGGRGTAEPRVELAEAIVEAVVAAAAAVA